MRRRLCALLFMLQVLPATASLASDDRLSQGALEPLTLAESMVVCRIVPRHPDAGSRSNRPICIPGLPERLCSRDTPWPGSDPVDVRSVSGCQQGDCILDTSGNSVGDCAGLSIQPRQRRDPDALEQRH